MGKKAFKTGDEIFQERFGWSNLARRMRERNPCCEAAGSLPDKNKVSKNNGGIE